jgi:alanine-glyoxylate transaminase/serine-glyoxylate transaminase/serine-pyruvate transaminase
MDISNPDSLSPPDRLLAGPGPSNVGRGVLAAMQKPMLGHLDPDFHDILLEVVELQRQVYRAPEAGLVIPLHCTGSAGMEAGLSSLLAPGEKIIVGQCGFFGRRLSEMAARYGAEVIAVDADWGEVVSNEALLAALEQHPDTSVLAVVHGETSTGVEHPLAELAAQMAGRDTLLMVDCVTSLGGVPFEFDAWGVDYAYSCTQKCVGAPPGMSPIAVSKRALERIQSRPTQVPWSLDLEMLERYWIQRPIVYHHTAPILHIYALYEAMREALDEGLENRWARHAEAGAYLQREVRSRGLELLADSNHQLAPLTAIRIPEGVDAKAVQTRMLYEHGIEIGGGLGPAAPPMWRLGLMGVNASVATADRLLTAMDAVLAEDQALIRAT